MHAALSNGHFGKEKVGVFLSSTGVPSGCLIVTCVLHEQHLEEL